MVTGNQTNKSIDNEVRTNAIIQQKRDEAEHEANQARSIGDVVLMIGDDTEESTNQSVMHVSSKMTQVKHDFHPNALHDPEVEPVVSGSRVHNPSGGSPHSTHSIAVSYAPPPSQSPHSHVIHHHGSTSNHTHAASPKHRPVQPVATLPGLDLRHTGLGASKHQETNMFLSHTIGHTHTQTTSHHTPHSQSAGANKNQSTGVFANELVPRMDFESCFYGSEALCQRCGKLVLVPLINVHVQSCKVKNLVLPGNVSIKQLNQTMNDDLLRINRASSIPNHTSDDSSITRSTNPMKLAHKRTSSSHQAFDDIAVASKSEGQRATARRSNREPLGPLRLNDVAAEAEPLMLDENGVPMAPPLLAIVAEVSAGIMHRRQSSMMASIGPKKRDIRSKRVSVQYQ